MSLKFFHLVFIALSIVLAAFVAAWALAQYYSVHDVTYIVAAVGAIAAAAALAIYATLFQRKVRRL